MHIFRLLQLVLTFPLLTLSRPHDVDQHPILQHQVLNATVTPVPIVLGVMSQCPDALLCETILDTVFQETWPLISVNLSFIGKLSDSEVTCKHGATECIGNIHELCAMHLSSTQQKWWSFLQCLNFEGKDSIGDAGLAEKCANVARIPWEDQDEIEGMKTCVEGEKGAELLRKSVTTSESLGIKTSCSIMISGKIRCIHDSTWKECETGHTEAEFKEYIQDEYARLNNDHIYDN